MSEFFLQLYCDSNSSYSLIIEDDGRVAYAYLMNNEAMIGDVWLYNQESSPLVVNWENKNEMPFLNPLSFVNINLPPIENDNEISLNWIFLDDDDLQSVEIYIKGTLVAKVSPGSFPGWSTVVTKDGVLAKILK